MEPSMGRTYTKGRRQPFLIRKWPGSNWALPLGPYTITQLLVFVASVYLLLSYRDLWAHFGAFNLIIGVGLPIALTYATRHSRVEGRDPLRAGVALAGWLLQPRTGYLGGDAYQPRRPVRVPGARFPVARMPSRVLAPPPPPYHPASSPRSIGQLPGRVPGQLPARPAGQLQALLPWASEERARTFREGER